MSTSPEDSELVITIMAGAQEPRPATNARGCQALFEAH